MKISKIKARLEEGNARFVADKLDGKLQDSVRREQLTSGQKPYAVVLGCADSRVIPELIFDTGLGELFVVRVAGNVANVASVASVEYAIAHCGSILIIVLGHQSCGAITAAAQGGECGDSLKYLLSYAKPAVDALPPGTDINEIVKKNAILTGQELYNRSEIIRDAMKKGELRIHPAYYSLDTGAVEFLDAEYG